MKPARVRRDKFSLTDHVAAFAVAFSPSSICWFGLSSNPSSSSHIAPASHLTSTSPDLNRTLLADYKTTIRNMASPQQRPAAPNIHGILPPTSCNYWGANATVLKVATPLTKRGFRKSLLVRNGSLEPVIARMVQDSATLKAWFSLRLKPFEHQKGQKIPSASWECVLALLHQFGSTWIEQYRGSENRADEWEIGEPQSLTGTISKHPR